MKSHDLVLSRGVIRINFYVVLPGFKYHMAGKDGKTETSQEVIRSGYKGFSGDITECSPCSDLDDSLEKLVE